MFPQTKDNMPYENSLRFSFTRVISIKRSETFRLELSTNILYVTSLTYDTCLIYGKIKMHGYQGEKKKYF